MRRVISRNLQPRFGSLVADLVRSLFTQNMLMFKCVHARHWPAVYCCKVMIGESMFAVCAEWTLELESIFHLTFSLLTKLKENFNQVGDLHARSLYWDFIELIMLLFRITNDVTVPFVCFFSEIAAERPLQESISTITSIQILSFSSARDWTSTWVDSCSLHAVSTSVKC